MKGALIYYSSTGNTELLCKYIASKISNANFDLYNVVKERPKNLEEYDIVGFLSPTNYFNIPKLLRAYIDNINYGNNKPAFILNTYGMMLGKTLHKFAKKLTNKGYHIIAAHKFNTPENYPPFIAKGLKNEQAPSKEEIKKLDDFISKLESLIEDINNEDKVKKALIKTGFLNSIIPAPSRRSIKKKAGQFKVIREKCSRCKSCIRLCPYDSIEYKNKPIFNANTCEYCFICFNHCPEKAIYTSEIRDGGHYSINNTEYPSKLNY